MVGLPSNFSTEYQRIAAYLADNVETDQIVEMSFSQAMFFSNFSQEIQVEKHIPESVEWYKEEGGIHLKGRACVVRKSKLILSRMVIVWFESGGS